MDEGLNGEIEYSIALGTNGTSLFDVKKFDDRAELRVATSLIGSSGSQLVTVVATDKGSPRRSASVDVMVTVVDMNLHRPVFIHPDESVYNVTSRFLPKVTVPEEVPIGSVITQIVAEDDDQGDNGRVWYYLMPAVNRDYEYFRLDRVTGNLTADKRLDREKQEVYEIQVRAEDNGQPTSLTKSLTMKVVLLDIDDNEPSFAGLGRPYEMRVKEEEEDAEVGMVVRPVDPDSNPNNSRICFYLYGGENVTRFQIDKNSGSLSIIGKFDQEETKYLDIVVKASSNCALSSASFPMNQPVSATAAAAAAAGGGAAAATAAAGAASVAAATGTNSDQPASYNQSDPSLLWVRVQVVDVNDNPPVFEDSSLSAGLIFDAEVGTEVVSLKNSVTDADTPGNSVHTFKLLSITPHLEQTEGLGLPREPFVVSVNGTVFTNTPFRSDMMGYFELKVQVSDKDGLNDTTDLRVYLISNLQRVKLVFDKLPNEVEELKHNLLRELSAVLGYDLIIDRIKTHTNPDGSRDPSKTDAFLHGRYKDTG
ncbi:cadherin-23, partial [Aplysia californica]|uniref:Cadherin-23 n=1 Tax=Aplysia californica TaxID=6500 RepID=A0ABM0K6T4_APLCA